MRVLLVEDEIRLTEDVAHALPVLHRLRKRGNSIGVESA
jgi:hypothetical protein